MEPQQGMWTRGRVTLVGDAASCVSLLAGQGSALAMVGAYILAGELHRSHGDYARGLRTIPGSVWAIRSQKAEGGVPVLRMLLRPGQGSALLRNRLFNLMAIPWMAELAAGRDLADSIALPSYK